MSGECYPSKNLHMEVNSSRKDKTMEINNSRYDPNEKTDQFLDYETMVSSAENKCSQLKGQLDRIKQFYNNQTELAKTSPRLSSASKSTRGKTASLIEPSFNNKDTNSVKVAKMIRQNSHAIGTDTTGAALGTINNILEGITQSIPIPEDFFQKIQPYECKSTSKIEADNKCQETLRGVENVKINSKSKPLITIKSKSRLKTRRSRSKVASITSSSNFKKIKKSTIKVADKRHIRSNEKQVIKSLPGTTVPVINKRIKKILVKQMASKDTVKEGSIPSTRIPIRNPETRIIARTPETRIPTRNPDLVEIYHNNAVQESKSSDSDVTKKKYPKVIEKAGTDVDLIPPLSIAEEVKDEPKRVVSCIYRNYTMPTISSRMKRVAKFYMNSFNIKAIPFCPATSTTASHNIGINIQQVMSMVKTKQPVGQLSPTLAYNIGLAAGKWRVSTGPFLESSIVSRSFYSHCPLSKGGVNYQHMQEIAKTFPQDIIEETEENDDINSPETQSIIITGPSGDVKVTNRKQPIWTAKYEEKKCTCITPKGIGFQQIINKFNGTISKPKINNTPIVSVKMKEQKTEHTCVVREECIKASGEFMPLQNKEKKLKEVLGKLHDEFEKMSQTYEDLAKKNQEGTANAEAIKQLEMLDKELNSKEEEIVMVMALYKEVLALKQQVKTLRERTSKENISIRNLPSKFSSYNKLTTAGLLNKLLQRVQHFQTHYKRS